MSQMSNQGDDFSHNHGPKCHKALNRSKACGQNVPSLLAPHFNLTVELPLKAIVRGFSWTTTPITWRNRRTGVAKLKIREMGSRYFFIVAYVWLEKYFSRGDYRRQPQPAVSSAPAVVDDIPRSVQSCAS